MSRSTERSAALFERAERVMIEGGSSPSRGPANYGDYPPFIERGEGAWIVDADGNRYVDWMMSYGALPLGHAHPAVARAVAEAAETGTHFAAATEIEIEVAELVRDLVPGAERVRFANTGTEATMAAIRLARGVTGRPKFLKFEGHYHGWYDDFLVTSNPQPVTSLGHRNDPVKIPDSSGLNRRSLDDTLVAPWNDIEAVERALKANRGRVAAVITEGVMANIGVIPARDGYLRDLRALPREHDVLLILDETVTGFRIGPGGCQQRYGVEADIVTFGKGLGAGLPVAAFAGRADLMDALAWGGVLHYGTQNGSRIGLHAARANLTELARDDGSGFRTMWEVGERLRTRLQAVLDAHGVAAVAQGVGPMVHVLFTERDAIRDYREFCAFVDRDRYRRLALRLFDHGVYLTPSAALHSVASTAHGDAEIEHTVEALDRALGAGAAG